MKLFTTIAAGILLLQGAIATSAQAREPQAQSGGTITGFVVPNHVGANEPFTFAAQNVIEGEVVSIKTVEGEVVATKKADRLGRVFLAGGLAAGAYLLTSRSGGSAPLNVQTAPNLSAPSLSIPQIPGNIDITQGLSLSGEGMSPNAADMMVKFGKNEFPVLAGTASEMKTGPLPSSACGKGPMQVVNKQTGDTSSLGDMVCYELTAKIARQKLVGGEQTQLEFTFTPKNLNAIIDVNILSGPVTFDGGATSVKAVIANGAASLKLRANPNGKGQFKVAYDIHEVLGPGKVDPSLLQPVKPAGPIGGGKTEPADNVKKERCPLTKHIRDEATGWKTSEKKVTDPATGVVTTTYIASRTIRCSIHKSCSKEKDHSPECAFTARRRCKDHETTETREYASEDARKDGMKDTAIPPSLKTPK